MINVNNLFMRVEELTNEKDKLLTNVKQNLEIIEDLYNNKPICGVPDIIEETCKLIKECEEK